MKKAISIILVLATLLSMTACAKDNGDDTVSTSAQDAATTEANNIPEIVYEDDDLPDDLDFGGTTINILSKDNSKEKNSLPEISAEELTNEVINDSIYNREKFVEERLGVEINNPKTNDVRTAIEKQLSSGEDSYQIHAIDGISLARVSMYNYFVDLYDLEYINFDKPWWSSIFNEEAEVFGKLYLTTGALSLSLYREMYVIYYNTALAEDYSVSNPELLDIYGIVDSGKWTIDKMTELGGNIYTDLNGNSIRDGEDLFGIAYTKTSSDAIWGSFDLNVFSKTEDGWFEFDVNTNKLYSALEKMHNLFYNTQGCLASSNGDELYNYDSEHLCSFFAGGSILFVVNYMYAAELSDLRNMKDNYGILPFPKYDENQQQYYSCTSDIPTCFSIPTTNTDPDVAAAVLEAMASYSYRNTRIAYLDTALKGKYMNDPDSRRMVDYIVNGYNVDASWIYFDMSLEYPASFRYMLIDGETGYASKHASKEKQVQRSLKGYRAEFLDQ